MAIKRPFAYSRAAVRFLAAAGVAALVAGCSDASRFIGDPFSDPFSGSAKTASVGVDRAPVGAIASAPAQSAPSSAVESRPLPAPAASGSAPGASAFNRSNRPACARAVAGARRGRPAATGAPRAARRSLSPRARPQICSPPATACPQRPCCARTASISRPRFSRARVS